MKEKLGLGFLGFPDIKTLAGWGRSAEAAGFDSVWVAETRITRDAVTGMTALCLATDRIRIGSAAINPYTRGAVLTAITWGAMAEAAPARVVLGIGPGSPAPLGQQGFEFDAALERLDEFTAAVRATWSDELPVDFAGKHVRLVGLTPEVRPDAAPPVYYCVTGPRALEAAGRSSDGVVFNAFMPPSYVERARTRLDKGAGGTFEGEVGGAITITVADSVSEAAANLRPILATYLAFFPHLARETGLDPEFLLKVQTLAADQGLEATFEMLPDELVTQHCLCGPLDVCKARLEDYRAAGLELPILFPDPGSVQAVIDGFL
jgi:5,10-methylenetetrahydromethanopterin reductase